MPLSQPFPLLGHTQLVSTAARLKMARFWALTALPWAKWVAAGRCWIASDSKAAVAGVAASRRMAGAGLRLGFAVELAASSAAGLATAVTVPFGSPRAELAQSGLESESRCPLRRSEEE